MSRKSEILELSVKVFFLEARRSFCAALKDSCSYFVNEHLCGPVQAPFKTPTSELQSFFEHERVLIY